MLCKPEARKCTSLLKRAPFVMSQRALTPPSSISATSVVGPPTFFGFFFSTFLHGKGWEVESPPPPLQPLLVPPGLKAL